MNNLPKGSVTSASSFYHNCYTTTEGSIFYLNQVPIQDTWSKFEQNAGLSGVIYSTGSTVSLDGSAFKDTIANYGSILYLDGGSVTFNNASLRYGKALNQGGAIYAKGTTSQSLTFSNCQGTNSFYESK